MYVITGATGPLNGATVDSLLTTIPAEEIVVVVRTPARAQRFRDMGIEVRHGDYADPASLPEAFAGADQLLLVSSSDPAGDAVALHRAAIDAAVAAGVGRILYTSHQGAALDSAFAPARDHAATEQLLAESGVPWTALRNGYYAHSMLPLLGAWRETGVITIPVDGPMSWTAREESAEAAATILLSDGGFDGPTTLTGSAAPTFADIAAIASEVAGRDVRLLVIGEEEWVAERVAAGTNEFAARFVLGMFQAAAQGKFAGTDPLLAELLRREPRSVRDLLERS